VSVRNTILTLDPDRSLVRIGEDHCTIPTVPLSRLK